MTHRYFKCSSEFDNTEPPTPVLFNPPTIYIANRYPSMRDFICSPKAPPPTPVIEEKKSFLSRLSEFCFNQNLFCRKSLTKN